MKLKTKLTTRQEQEIVDALALTRAMTYKARVHMEDGGVLHLPPDLPSAEAVESDAPDDVVRLLYGARAAVFAQARGVTADKVIEIVGAEEDAHQVRRLQLAIRQANLRNAAISGKHPQSCIGAIAGVL